MTKLNVLETYFKTISDSMEWGDTCKETEYFNYVDGVTTMTKNILNDLEKVVDCNEENKDAYDKEDNCKQIPEIVPRPRFEVDQTPITNPFKEVLCRCIDTE